MHKAIFSKLLHRPTDSHKYDYGHVLVVGGSPGMVGAPLLAGEAALRVGSGLVTIAAVAAVTDKLEKRVEEIMTLALPDEPEAAAARLQTFITERKVSVLVIGPGLAASPQNTKLVSKLVKNTSLPLIIDGGGLSALQNRTDELTEAASKDIILTPHAGEFRRLLDTELPSDRKALKPLAERFAHEYHVTLVLKGEPTYVAHPSEQTYENNTGNPGLATAGTGDVLSGVIAGIIAQKIAPAEAAEAAVYLHGLAGDIVAERKTEPGMVAGDVIEALPEALRGLRGTL